MCESEWGSKVYVSILPPKYWGSKTTYFRRFSVTSQLNRKFNGL